MAQWLNNASRASLFQKIPAETAGRGQRRQLTRARPHATVTP